MYTIASHIGIIFESVTVGPISTSNKTQSLIRLRGLSGLKLHFDSTVHPWLWSIYYLRLAQSSRWPPIVIYKWLQSCNVICISTTCMLLIFLMLTVFMLVLMLEVQKRCNGVVDTWIQVLLKQPPDCRGSDN